MTSAPMTGKIVADLVTGRPPSIDIRPFSAVRFR
jgi:glycine/D-amino acid oxidase-like deaminating enzyme